jgi:IS30 family transposase
MSKFLTYEDRLTIAKGLKETLSFGAIATLIGKDRTTIAKEIKKYSYEKKSGRPGYPWRSSGMPTHQGP